MEPTQTDILISRIVDDEASAGDWSAFERLAELEPDVWRRLAQEQRDAASLARAVASATEVADAVELPLGVSGHGAEQAFTARFGGWAGWAIAAAVALAWLGFNEIPGMQGRDIANGNRAGIATIPVSADAALNQYREVGEQEGRYLGEMPKVMVEARPIPGGAQIEVIYLRQLLEREVVRGMYGFAEDDQGRATPVPIEPTVIQASDPL
ncbi:MAG: hypothetical protein H6813_05085 [Phycisphaeraceae bacterium]|nr:hypothetical protein [Phycisphaeraceae bacterium]MCB9847758.1 hypothetical protein [Phycisphaeraceae bacterium]